MYFYVLITLFCYIIKSPKIVSFNPIKIEIELLKFIKKYQDKNNGGKLINFQYFNKTSVYYYIKKQCKNLSHTGLSFYLHLYIHENRSTYLNLLQKNINTYNKINKIVVSFMLQCYR